MANLPFVPLLPGFPFSAVAGYLAGDPALFLRPADGGGASKCLQQLSKYTLPAVPFFEFAGDLMSRGEQTTNE